jgi:hypothetical protein
MKSETTKEGVAKGNYSVAQSTIESQASPTFNFICIKMKLSTYCALQFSGDIIFGLVNLFIFFLASSLLNVSINIYKFISPLLINCKGGYYTLVIVQVLLYTLTIISGCKFLSASKKDGPERRRLIKSPANVHNIWRILMWSWSAIIYSVMILFAIKNKKNNNVYVYDSDRNKGLNLYILFFTLVTLFSIYQILLVPLVRK